MQEFFPEIEIRSDQAEAMARGFYAVAKADGTLHAREAALITEFFASTTENAADLGALERSAHVDGSYLAAMLPSRDLRTVFIKTALLLAYSDGTYSPNEGKVVAEFAKALGIHDTDAKKLEAQVKEFMLAQLTHVQNTQAVAEVAKELKV